MTKKILLVVGTRPNFVKITQFRKCIAKYPDLLLIIVHTGQHSDVQMSDVFFRQFELQPDHFLNISNISVNRQMAEIMIGLEEVIMVNKPHLVVVVGDVNSTFAACLTAHKLKVATAHLESGLRSFDRTMPEEINRILTDELSDYYFVSEQSGWDNLIKEGKKPESIFYVGNTMIDSMVAYDDKINASDVLEELEIIDKPFILMTIHRPATVDDNGELLKLLNIIRYLAKKYTIVFPVHPRTISNLKKYGVYNDFEEIKNLILIQPLDYFGFQKLIKACKLVLTDSGGIQEESTFRLKPCITLRNNTERPSTIELGTNTLVDFNFENIRNIIEDIESGNYKSGAVPPKWDGMATERIAGVLNEILNKIELE
jgi:UDP-N-acetylglucosamine 2-epimerase (non-hydrolysing)